MEEEACSSQILLVDEEEDDDNDNPQLRNTGTYFIYVFVNLDGWVVLTFDHIMEAGNNGHARKYKAIVHSTLCPQYCILMNSPNTSC